MKVAKFKKKIAILLSAVLTMSAVVGCSSSGNNVEADGVVLNVQVGSEPATIDPAKNSAADAATLINHAFEGLMKLDKDGKTIVEGQAAKYEVNDDQTVYTFTDRKSVV